MLSDMPPVEHHPFKPFLPEHARLLMLGTFPPARKRWSMEFYYPNYQNDMWRIFGLCFFGDKDHFLLPAERRFNQPLIEAFLTERGIALYDTATSIRRLRDTASDKDLDIVVPTDIDALLRRLPMCRAVATAGQLATTQLATRYGVSSPPMGSNVSFTALNRTLQLWRMPSSSRAYPMAAERKAAIYQQLFDSLE